MSFRWNCSAGRGILMPVVTFSLILLLQTGVLAQSPPPPQSPADPDRLLVKAGSPAATAPVTIPEPEIGMKNPAPVVNLVPFTGKFEGIFAMPEWTLAETKTFEATAYSLRGRTRSGIHVRRGVIAADPEVLPLGSIVQLTAGRYSGVYTVHDTGGRIKGDVIDLWMPSRREARQFGRQNVRVQVLKMGKTRVKP
jgi:3D (Asp-Asp-Asp) domain-containing protein